MRKLEHSKCKQTQTSALFPPMIRTHTYDTTAPIPARYTLGFFNEATMRNPPKTRQVGNGMRDGRRGLDKSCSFGVFVDTSF